MSESWSRRRVPPHIEPIGWVSALDEEPRPVLGYVRLPERPRDALTPDSDIRLVALLRWFPTTATEQMQAVMTSMRAQYAGVPPVSTDYSAKGRA